MQSFPRLSVCYQFVFIFLASQSFGIHSSEKAIIAQWPVILEDQGNIAASENDILKNALNAPTIEVFVSVLTSLFDLAENCRTTIILGILLKLNNESDKLRFEIMAEKLGSKITEFSRLECINFIKFFDNQKHLLAITHVRTLYNQLCSHMITSGSIEPLFSQKNTQRKKPSQDRKVINTEKQPILKVSRKLGPNETKVFNETLAFIPHATEADREKLKEVMVELDPMRFRFRSHGLTPLHMGAIVGDFEYVKSLLARGIDKNKGADDGATALHHACSRGRTAIAQILTTAGAAIEAQDSNGERPLHWAAESGNYYIVKLLLEKNADKSAEDLEGRKPIDYVDRGLIELLAAE